MIMIKMPMKWAVSFFLLGLAVLAITLFAVWYQRYKIARTSPIYPIPSGYKEVVCELGMQSVPEFDGQKWQTRCVVQRGFLN